MSAKAKKTRRGVLVRQSRDKIQLLPDDLDTAVSVGQAIALSQTPYGREIAQVNSGTCHTAKENFTMAYAPSVEWKNGVLRHLLHAFAVEPRWDRQLVDTVIKKKKWLDRHLMEYKVEDLPDAEPYEQEKTVESEYPELLASWLKEVEKRPWAGVLKPYQREDVARILCKDMAYIGSQQGLGKTVIYAAIIDILAAKRQRSLSGYDPNRKQKPFGLIVCEPKAVWDAQLDIRDRLGLESKIIESIVDVDDPCPIHIASYTKLSMNYERWEKLPCLHCGEILTEKECTKKECKELLRYEEILSTRPALPPFHCYYCNIIHPLDECPICHVPYMGNLFRADREVWRKELFSHRSGKFYAPRGFPSGQHVPWGLICKRNAMSRAIGKRYSLVILDESFSIQNAKAKRTSAIFHLRPKRRRYMGTGTVMDGVADDCFSQFGWCFGFDKPTFPYKRNSIYTFRADFCERVERDTARGTVTSVLVNKTDPDALKKWYRLLYPKMVRRTSGSKEVAEQMNLAAPKHRLVEVDMDMYDRGFYSVFLNEFAARFNEMVLEAKLQRRTVNDQSILAQMWYLRQATANPQHPDLQKLYAYRRDISSKQRVLLNLLNEYIAAGDKVCIGAGFPNICNGIASMLFRHGHNSIVLTGESTPRERQARIQKWKSDPDQKILICSIPAEKTQRTFVESNHYMFMDMSWSPLENEQAWKRIHRMGQKKICTIDYICCQQTIDKVIYDSASVKQLSTNLSIDRRKKTDYAESHISAFDLALKVMAFASQFESDLRRVMDEEGLAVITETGKESILMRKPSTEALIGNFPED